MARQFECFEVNIPGVGTQAVVTAACFATFTLAQRDGTVTSKRVKGFCRKDGTFCVRFLPKSCGTLTYMVEPSPLFAKGVRLSGREEVLPAAPGCHGIVKALGTSFVFEDGTRYLPVGTTVYAMVHQTRDLLEETLRSLAASPFNKVRFCLFPKYFFYNREEPQHFPFVRGADGHFDFSMPDEAFWSRLEETIRRLADLGIQADLILFHPYDHWGFASMTKKECEDTLSYAARRLSAFPNLWWSLANEYDTMTHFARSWWPDFAALLHREDPYGHLLSNHHCITEWDFSNPDTTHVCLQTVRTIRIPSYRRRFHKPVVVDECGYEGDLPYSWGDLTGRELMRRIWTGYVLGGFVSHGETLLAPKDAGRVPDDGGDDAVLWWAKGGTLRGEAVPRIAYLKTVLESLPGPIDPCPLDPDNDREVLQRRLSDPEQARGMTDVQRDLAAMSDSDYQDFEDSARDIAGQVEDLAYLRYFGAHQPSSSWLSLPGNAAYTIRVLDTWQMEEIRCMHHAAGKTSVPLPGTPDILVLAIRE
ncbi:MAG: DUF4038 domain-containing protein [Lachnospiraceae bacterium]